MIDAAELRLLSTRAGMPESAVHIVNESYLLTTPDYMSQTLGHALDRFYFNSGITFAFDRWDCDAYALGACFHAKAAWARTVPGEVSIAVGWFACLGLGHVLVVAAHRDDKGGLYLAWYEPQPAVADNTQAFQLVCMLPKTLTPDDIATCSLCLWC